MKGTVPPKKGAKRIGSLASLAEVLPVLYQELDLDKKVNEMALLALWAKQVEAIAGSKAVGHTRAIRLKKQGYKTILMVMVSNAALASELSFHVSALKDALNGFAPQTGLTVDQIKLMVGSL